MRAAVNISQLVPHPNDASIMKQIWLLSVAADRSGGAPAALHM